MHYGRKDLTIFSAYASTITNLYDIKDKFYENLHEAIASVPKTDKLYSLGDFNARIGLDNISWKGTIGKYSVGRSISK